MKTKENQNIEWKESWQDEYLKWICGFEGIGSKPRNPLIAGVFFRSGQIEAWGRGIKKMNDLCIADNLPAPKINILPSIFSISFNIHKNMNELTENFTENLKDILELMKNNPSVSFDELSQKIGISRRAIINNTNKLKKLKLIERIGADKGGYWRIIK